MAPFTTDLGGTGLAIRSAAEYHQESTPDTSASRNQLLPALQDASNSGSRSASSENSVADGIAQRADFVERVEAIIGSKDQQHPRSVPPPQGVQEGVKTTANSVATHNDLNLTRSHSDMDREQRIVRATESVIDLKDIQDDELLDILIKNETIAARFQKECHSRLEQNQQRLEHAYKQRLDELENCTRQWRHNTEELWQAIKAGNCPATTQQQQEHLDWSGPQQMAHEMGLVSDLSTLCLELTDGHACTETQEPNNHSPKSLSTVTKDWEGPVAPTVHPTAHSRVESPLPDRLPHECETSQLSDTARLTSADASLGSPSALPAVQIQKPQTLSAQWVADTKGYKADEAQHTLNKGSTRLIEILSFGDLEARFPKFLGSPKNRRMVVKYVDEKRQLTYRDINAIHSVLGGLLNTDIIIDLTYENVVLFGRALCYLKERRDRLSSLVKLLHAPFVDSEIRKLCAFFSSQPTSITLRIKRFRPSEARISDIFSAENRSVPATSKLLIVRPKHQEGRISGAEFFDVGIERQVARLKNG